MRRRKLIEVALPLAAINRESVREKSIRHGHPSALHQWWGRKPLATCRAVLFASLVDDPSSRPEEFPTDEAQEAERQRLFRIIEALVRWEATTDETVLEAARAEIRRSCGGAPPPVLDPFCGGGSIPLEAQRLGLEAHGSDLNPVAVLITKALIEIPPRFAGRPPVHPEEGRSHAGSWRGAQGLAEDVRHCGRWMRDQAWQRVGHLYPTVTLPPERGGGEATVIAWLWARTVTCPNPACGIRMPLVHSFALSTKKGRERFAKPIPDRAAGVVRFAVREGADAPEGTVNRRGARCVACGEPVPLNHVRAEGRAGRMGAQLMAIFAQGRRERVYLPPTGEHEAIAASAEPHWAPEGEITASGIGIRTQIYGVTHHRDLFTRRQLAALATFADLVGEARERVLADALAAGLPDDGVRLADGGSGAAAYADVVATYLAFALDRAANTWSSASLWNTSTSCASHAFIRPAFSIVWNFAESNPFGVRSGAWDHECVEWLATALERLPAAPAASCRQMDAAHSVTGVEEPMISTDPPYYDVIGYAGLSDFFFVWLRRCLGGVWPRLFGTPLTPKDEEMVANPQRAGSRDAATAFFQHGMGEAFALMREAHNPDYPLTVYYGCKQVTTDRSDGGGIASTGWEALLEALIAGGFGIAATWPVQTERPARMADLAGNALASSIVLVCRPRIASAPAATRSEFVATLDREFPAQLRNLVHTGVAPVDIAQTMIGPGMEVFCRYAKVVEAGGSPMGVRTALGLINRALDRASALCDCDLDAATRAAVARFEESAEAPGEDAQSDGAGSAWTTVHSLIHAMATGGEGAAALVMRDVGGDCEPARALAYRLHVICERRGRERSAGAYNSLVVSWPEIVRLSAAQQTLEMW